MHLRRASLTAILTAVLLTAGTTASVAATQPAASAAPAAVEALTASGAPAGVPWARVGPGWILAQYTTAHPEGGASGPETLDLISPSGTKYQLARWPDSRFAPVLLAWSPDGKRALFEVFSGKGGVEVLTLATGQPSTFVMPSMANPVGFTAPDGLNIVGGRQSGSLTSLARYTLSGRLAHSLGTSTDGLVLYQPSGTEFLTGASHGLKLVSNDGTQIRNLPVPRATVNSCAPVRWWNASTVLASCDPPDSASPQLWLVPVSGARPQALTPPRRVSSGDLGDLDAWALSSGLYLQAAGPCAVLQIFKQARNGSITLVKVPHTEGDNDVLTALGPRLLIQAPTSCTGSNSLLWFNPGTGAEQWLIRAPANQIGVTVALPFYSREDGNR
jgi:TolB protein